MVKNYEKMTDKELKDELSQRGCTDHLSLNRYKLIALLRDSDSFTLGGMPGLVGSTTIPKKKPVKKWAVIVTRPNVESLTIFKTKKLASEFLRKINNGNARLTTVPIFSYLPDVRYNGTQMIVEGGGF